MTASVEAIALSGWLPVQLPTVPGFAFAPGTAAWRRGNCTTFVAQEPDDNGKLLWHLSMSYPFRSPTWDELRDARYLFIPDEVTMAQVLPPKAMYLNVMPYCHHLWQIADWRNR